MTTDRPNEGVLPLGSDKFSNLEVRNLDAEEGTRERSTREDDDFVDPLEQITFPKSLLKRIVKERMEPEGNEVNGDLSKVQISKSCLEAFEEAAKLFIHYTTWSAGEELRKTKRQTIGVEDVLSGLDESEYGEYVAHLREYVTKLQATKKKGFRNRC